jgi:hypothetical protein
MGDAAVKTVPATMPLERFWRRPGPVWAVVVGLLAALLGVLLEWLGWRLTDRWLSLLALLTGVLTGLGVRLGSGARGGWLYQGLAVVLAYLAIVAGHLPAFDLADVRSIAAFGGGPFFLFLVSLPFLRGLNSTFDLALIVLGLFQAAYWNRKSRHMAIPASELPR